MKKVMFTKIYVCEFCKKNYKTSSSLWNHKNKFHLPTLTKSDVNTMSIQCQYNNNDTINSITCPNCMTQFTTRQAKSLHIKKFCKKIDLQNQINELKEKFAMILEEKGRIHHKTLTKFNNQLNNINIMNESINHGTININNGTINHVNYITFPNLSFEHVLDEQQIIKILNKQYKSIEESIKLIHFNDDIPEYNNIFITNLKDDLAYVFNGKKFIAVKKNDMVNKLIDTHASEINLSMNRLEDKLTKSVISRLTNFLDKLNDEYTKYDDDSGMYSNYKAYKFNIIKLLIYNSSSKKKLNLLKKSMESLIND